MGAGGRSNADSASAPGMAVDAAPCAASGLDSSPASGFGSLTTSLGPAPGSGGAGVASAGAAGCCWFLCSSSALILRRSITVNFGVSLMFFQSSNPSSRRVDSSILLILLARFQNRRRGQNTGAACSRSGGVGKGLVAKSRVPGGWSWLLR